MAQGGDELLPGLVANQTENGLESMSKFPCNSLAWRDLVGFYGLESPRNHHIFPVGSP